MHITFLSPIVSGYILRAMLNGVSSFVRRTGLVFFRIDLADLSSILHIAGGCYLLL